MASHPKKPDLIVKPRKSTTNAQRPVIVWDVHRQMFLTEEGEVGEFDWFSQMLYNLEPAIIVTQDSMTLLHALHERWKFDEAWMFSVTPIKRHIFQARSHHTGHRIYELLASVNFFGWRHGKFTNYKIKNKWHFLIDPVTFASFRIKSHDVPDLLTWGKEIRDFCVEQNLNLKPTQGSLARQFLKDSRFYPEPRRKVPRATNDRVRPHLGNHYEIRAATNREYTGIYLDQKKAHHYHAEHAQLPNANSLLAFGQFGSDYDEATDKPWRFRRERVDSFLRGFAGLVYGHLAYKKRPCRWIPPYLDEAAEGKPVFWLTSERDLLDSLGAKPQTIIAAWGSKEADTGLAAFSRFAQNYVDPPSWLKPLFLSVYGTLATTPREYKVGFYGVDTGEPVTIRAGKHNLEVMLRTAKTASEPQTNNVLHRALIEGATRCESLMFANWLQSRNHTVLCVYVDAVIVMDKGIPIPELYEPWEYEETLHHLRFISSNAFASDEVTKIPGGQTREEAMRYRPAMRGPLHHLFWNRDQIRVKRVRPTGVPNRPSEPMIDRGRTPPPGVIQ